MCAWPSFLLSFNALEVGHSSNFIVVEKKFMSTLYTTNSLKKKNLIPLTIYAVENGMVAVNTTRWVDDIKWEIEYLHN